MTEQSALLIVLIAVCLLGLVAGGLLIGASLWYNHKTLTGGEQWSSSKWAKFLDEQ